MKKDKKFLLELENELNGISKKKRDAIVLKYRNLIDEELSKKKKIKDILKNIGTPKEIAILEKEFLKQNKKINLSGIKEGLKTTSTNIKKVSKKASTGIKKFYGAITKEIELKPRKEIDEEKINKKNIKENTKKESQTKQKEEVKNNILKEKKTIKDKQKTKKIKDEKEKNKKNINKLKENKSEGKKLFNFKKKEEKNKSEQIIEEISNEKIEEICEVSEIVTNNNIFISKEERRKKIIFQTLGVILITFVLFAWLWISVIFVASIFALLDGVKIYGVNISLLGIDILILWLIIMLNKAIFKKKNNFKFNLLIIISSILLTAIGIALTIYQITKIEIENDVSQKYNMTTKYDTYSLPSNDQDKMYIIFNSNYDTQYMVKYDDNLEGKFKIEVKYYENYYDYYVKKSSNNIYVSLSKDSRDRISSYIDDFKENKIYNEDELSRYIVKITINEKDYKRLVIEN